MKKAFFTCFLLTAILLPFSTLAQDVELSLIEGGIVGYTGESVSTEIKIYNYQKRPDTFTITIWPPYWAGISATPEKSTVKMPANSSEAVKIYFSIPIATEEMILNFNIAVESLTDEKISDSKILSLSVVRKVPIYISEIKLNKHALNPLETFKIDVSVTNLDIKPNSVSLEINIKKDEEIIQRFYEAFEIPAKSTQKKENSFVFEKYTNPGNYKIEAMLRDDLNRAISTKETALKVNAIHNITHEEFVSHNLLLQTITIKAKNQGNIPTASFYLTVDVPSFMKSFIQPIEHYTTESMHDRTLYHWLVPSLAPGEERIAMYKISLWNAWALILIIIALVGFGFMYVFTPKIVKGFTHAGPIKRESEIIISLDLRNRGRREIKDVEIRDFVPSILGVVGRYDTLKPNLKKVREGTEIFWKLDSLKPKEERVLTYRIRPNVDIVGSLKLPKASVKYIERENVKKAIASKSIIIKPK